MVKTAPAGGKIDNSNDKLLAALSYVGLLFIVPLLAGRGSDYVRFHARQGMVLFVIDFFVSIIAWIPFIGWAVGVVALVASVYGIAQALAGNYWDMPLIGKYARKLDI